MQLPSEDGQQALNTDLAGVAPGPLHTLLEDETVKTEGDSGLNISEGWNDIGDGGTTC